MQKEKRKDENRDSEERSKEKKKRGSCRIDMGMVV